MAHYVCVTGGREPDETTLEDVREVLGFLHSFYGGTLRVIHGAARGVDTEAGRVCAERGIPVREFPADWGSGKGAGLERNEKMARVLFSWWGPEHTVEVIAFRGGRGTSHMISTAERLHLPLTVVPDLSQ